MHGPGALGTFLLLHAHEQAVDYLGAALLGAVAEVLVQHFASCHADVLVGAEGAADVHLAVRWAYHLHPVHLAVDDLRGKVELVDHAQGNGATTGLAVVHLPLNEVGLQPLLRQHLGRARAGWSSTHNGDPEGSVERCAVPDDSTRGDVSSRRPGAGTRLPQASVAHSLRGNLLHVLLLRQPRVCRPGLTHCPVDGPPGHRMLRRAFPGRRRTAGLVAPRDPHRRHQISK
mmetsp:Transcript_7216/g.18461  ORF Transcript_7216/g.18461 Transcript_7216/m.18461 type:complete len:230 (-) Transcript_7216:282-971(-)